MAQDEREKFLEWSASVGMSRSAAVRLLEHLPDDSALDPELPCWISSPSYSMAVNDPAHGGMGIETQLIQEGFLIIGSCPNGDPVVVSFRDSNLPVFYLNHEELHRKPLAEVMRSRAGGSRGALSCSGDSGVVSVVAIGRPEAGRGRFHVCRWARGGFSANTAPRIHASRGGSPVWVLRRALGFIGLVLR